MKNNPNKSSTKVKRNLLCSAISLCLPLAIQAADFSVTVSSDDGTGNTSGTLSHAIREANNSPGYDTITLATNVTLSGVMKRLIDSSITIQHDGTRRNISGNDQFRPLFIKSGTVTIQGINITDGYAKGGGTDDGGMGAGLGGALFIYDGNVSLNDVTFDNSKAFGGDELNNFTRAGGGMFGDSGIYYGGGGLFASGSGNMGGDGVNDNYQNPAADFGKGGDFTGSNPGENGGFGGGGGWPSGDGGFGGGGAGIYDDNAGNGGFGASAPYAGVNGTYSGTPGYGATNNGAAGMGGAIFIRTGQLDINNSTFSNNQATGSADAKGLGGAVFVLHSTTNSNNGTPASQQGMPVQLAAVTGCNNTFTDNSAPGSSGVPDDDNDVFDLGGVAEDLALPCPVEQNFVVTVASDNGLGDVPNSLSWAIKESNAVFGDDTITLATDVTLTGVMRRVIDSNLTIQSDGTRRSINGNTQFRPLFIKSGQVGLNGFAVIDGNAKGGDGYTGGAGMGGALFIYGGNINIHDMTFTNSSAIGGSSSGFGGGGMFGDGDNGGGGLFAPASGNTGGHGGYYGNFGRGGNADSPGLNGHFGGGGGAELYLGLSGAGHGGFGGGGGASDFNPGNGGFGGGSIINQGYGAANRNAAGMGGAVFIRSGEVTISNSEFNDNQAQANGDAKGLGGGLFVVHTTTNGSASQQGMPSTLANVTVCDVSFINNMASSAGNHANNNDDWFDEGRRITECPIFKNGFEPE